MIRQVVWVAAAIALVNSTRAVAQISEYKERSHTPKRAMLESHSSIKPRQLSRVEQQYIEVGEGARGMPVYLDLKSVRGTNFRLIQQFGDGVGITDIAAYCPQKRLFVELDRRYVF